MPQPPGSEPKYIHEKSFILTIAALGSNLLLQQHNKQVIALAGQILQIFKDNSAKYSDLDAGKLTKEIKESLQREYTGREDVLKWAARRATYILMNHGSAPVHGVRAGTLQPDAGEMADRVLSKAKGTELDPGEGEEKEAVRAILRVYYNVYLHHKEGIAEIAADAIMNIYQILIQLELELKEYINTRLKDNDRERALDDCYLLKNRNPPNTLELRSILAKHRLIPYVDTGQLKMAYNLIKNAEGPVLLAITGPGGSGKTRFAIELGKKLTEEGWEQCFLHGRGSVADYRHLYNGKSLLIVFDYALRKQETVSMLLNTAEEHGWGKYAILLLERLNMDRFVSVVNIQSNSLSNIKISKHTIDIKELNEEEAKILFEKAVYALKDYYNIATEENIDINSVWNIMQRYTHRRPIGIAIGALFALKGILGHLVKNNNVYNAGNIADVYDICINYIIDRVIIHNYWDNINENDRDLVKLIIACIALCKCTTVDNVKKILKIDINIDYKDYKKVFPACEGTRNTHRYSIDNTYYISTIEPDIIVDHIIIDIMKENKAVLINMINEIIKDNRYKIETVEHIAYLIHRAIIGYLFLPTSEIESELQHEILSVMICIISKENILAAANNNDNIEHYRLTHMLREYIESKKYIQYQSTKDESSNTQRISHPKGKGNIDTITRSAINDNEVVKEMKRNAIKRLRELCNEDERNDEMRGT